MFSSIWNGIKSAASSVYNTVSNIFGGGAGQTAGAANAVAPTSSAPKTVNAIQVPASVGPVNSPSYNAFVAANSGGASGANSFMVNQPAVPRSVSSGGGAPVANTNTQSYNSTGSSGANFSMGPQAPTSINSGSLTGGNTPISLTPYAPTTPKSYAGTAMLNNIAQGADPTTGLFPNAMSKVNPDGSINTTATEPTPQTEFDKYLSSLKAPTSEADSYNKAVQQTGLQEAQQRKQNTQNAINAVTTRVNTDLLRLRGTAQKEGVVEAVYGGQQQEIQREATIELLPLQAQLAVDQGNLEMANSNTDKLFKIYSDDARNSVDFYNNGVKATWDFFNDEEKKKATEVLWQKNQNADMVKMAANNQADIAKEFLKNGNMEAYRAITSVKIPSNVNSPTFKEDYDAYQKDLSNSAVRFGTPQNGGAVANENLLAYASQYSDTGKLPSPSELKLAGLTVGQVTSYAKQVPKPNGALVSTNTGTKSSSLSPTQEAGIQAMSEIVNSTLPNLKEVFPKIATGVLGGLGGMIWTSQDKQNYLTWRAEFLSKLLVARSGAAVTEQEYQRYSDLLPTTFNQPFFTGADGLKKLNALDTSMKSSLNSTLNNQQLSIYGYSKVNVNGEPHTVGEVLDIGGTKYRVLPDGTLTDVM